MRYFIFLILSLITSVLYAQEGTPEVIRGSDKFSLIVRTENNKTGLPIDGTEVYLYATKSSELLDVQTSSNGIVSFDIDPFTEYEIRTCNTLYFKNGMSLYECNQGNEILCTFGASDYNFVAGGGRDKPKAILKATLSLSPISVGSIMELENVYYDLDKATLSNSAIEELTELANIMNRNKSISIELSSHTDSRASDEYNSDLSQRRAQSCFDYLRSKGISTDRIKPVGYGERRLVNQCKDGVECTEGQHQKNRRTEIEILTYTPITCKPSMDIDFKVKDLKQDKDDK